MGAAYYVSFIGYLLALVVIGLYSYYRKDQSTMEGYVLGGRGLGWVTSGLSAMSSQSSGFMFIGLLGVGYAMGVYAFWYVVADVLNVVLAWVVLAPRIKLYADKTKSIDLPDFLSDRFKDATNAIRIIGAVIVCIFMVGYFASQLSAGGKAFEGASGIPYGWGVFISACLVVFYTMLGGYWGVCWTDVLQGIMMAFGIIVVPIVAIAHIGGIGAMFAKLSEINPLFLTIGGAKATAVAVGIVVGWMSIPFCVFGQPHVVTRMMAIKSPQQIKHASLLAVSWFSFTRTATIFAGLAARVLIPQLKDAEHAFPGLVTQYFPGWVAGIMMAAVLASIMSTGDSQLLAAATTVARNIYQKVIKPAATERNLVILTRILVLVISVLGFYFAVGAKRVVFWMILFAYAGSGAALGMPLIVSLFWKKATTPGCIAGMIAGTITIIVWKMTPALKAIVFEGLPGIIIAAGITIIVSLMTTPSPEAVKEYEEVLE